MDEKKENFNSISYKELIYFKEEILKDIKSKLNIMSNKYDSQKDDLSQKIQNMVFAGCRSISKPSIFSSV